MNIYLIYKSAHGAKNNSMMLIKQGFSLYAMIFHFMWAIYLGMWLVGSIIFAIISILFLFTSFCGGIVSQVILFFILMSIGIFASEIQEFHASRKKMYLDDIICAGSYEEAEVKYLHRNFSVESNT